MKHVLILVLLWLIFSCKQNQKSLYEFDPGKLEDNKISLSEIADDITYIPLDNSFPIGMIYRYKITNNSIFLSAKDVGVLMFDIKGKLLRRIGSIGRGPGEYKYCFSFTVDNNSGKTIVDNSGTSLVVYSSTGRFLRNISLKNYQGNPDVVEFYNSGLFISFCVQYDDPVNDWVVIDSLGNEIRKKQKTSPKFTSGWLAGGGTYKSGNAINYWNQFDDTVYSVSPDLSYKPAFLFGKGEFRFPKKDFKSIEELPKYMLLDQVFETNRFLVITYGLKRKLNLALIDKNNRKSYHIDIAATNVTGVTSSYEGGIFNDLDGGPPFQPGGATNKPECYIVEQGREYLIGSVNPFQIKALINSADFKNSKPKYPEKKSDLEQMANRLKETDNPVLMVVRLKK